MSKQSHKATDPKVFAVVVTYNRPSLLAECLRALQRQTHSLAAIVVVDNASTEDTVAALRQEGYRMVEQEAAEGITFVVMEAVEGPTLLYYLRLPVNLGGAGGFYYGMQLALMLGAEWLWLMDDDAEPAADALEQLWIAVAKHHAAAYGSLTRSARTGEIEPYHQCRLNLHSPLKQFLVPLMGEDLEHLSAVEVDQKSFVGLFVPRITIDIVGLPKKEMFLHWDDTEYCLRIRQGGKIYLVPQSVIWHKDAVVKSGRVPYRIGFLRLMRYARRDPYERYWLRYYTIRNMIWIAWRVAESRWETLWRIAGQFVRSVVGILLFDDHRWRRLRLLWAMYRDGIRGDFSDLWKPRRILYGEHSPDAAAVASNVEQFLNVVLRKKMEAV